MQLIDLINVIVVASHTGQRDNIKSTVKEYAIDRINIEYERLFNAYSWDDVKRFNLDVVTTDGVVILPRYVDTVSAVRIGNSPILPRGEIQSSNFDPGEPNVVGNLGKDSRGYVHREASALFVQATAAGVIKFVSSSAADSSASALTVRIEGLSSDQPLHEENVLNGITQVTTTASFDAGEVFKISKPLTTGTVIIYAADGLTELARIGPDEYQPFYKRFALDPVVNESTTVTIMGSRKFERLVSDYDSLEIPSLESTVIDLVTARMKDWTDNPSANVERALAKEGVESALLKENLKNAKNIRILPITGNFGFFDNNRFDTSITGIDRW